MNAIDFAYDAAALQSVFNNAAIAFAIVAVLVDARHRGDRPGQPGLRSESGAVIGRVGLYIGARLKIRILYGQFQILKKKRTVS